jgi:hypothetical protein
MQRVSMACDCPSHLDFGKHDCPECRLLEEQ